jgi:hypothetical protein
VIVASDGLAVGRSAREIAARELSGAGHVPVPRWYRDLTAFLVPESLRHAFGLRYDEREQRRPSEPFASCEPSRRTTKQEQACPAAGPVF